MCPLQFVSFWQHKVISNIERFSWDTGAWLKIAGDEKGAVLDDLVTFTQARLVLEFGCYVGYSSIRMARLLRLWQGRVLSVEVDPVHACIARSMLELAGLASNVDVHIGKPCDDATQPWRVSRSFQ